MAAPSTRNRFSRSLACAWVGLKGPGMEQGLRRAVEDACLIGRICVLMCPENCGYVYTFTYMHTYVHASKPTQCNKNMACIHTLHTCIPTLLALHTLLTSRKSIVLHYTKLRCITLYLALPYLTLPYLTLTYLTSPYPTLPYLTLHSAPFHSTPSIPLHYIALDYMT